jgi:hypothetical protein
VETPRKFITAKINTAVINNNNNNNNNTAVINLRGVSTNKTIICFIAMQTYKELNTN